MLITPMLTIMMMNNDYTYDNGGDGDDDGDDYDDDDGGDDNDDNDDYDDADDDESDEDDVDVENSKRKEKTRLVLESTAEFLRRELSEKEEPMFCQKLHQNDSTHLVFYPENFEKKRITRREISKKSRAKISAYEGEVEIYEVIRKKGRRRRRITRRRTSSNSSSSSRISKPGAQHQQRQLVVVIVVVVVEVEIGTTCSASVHIAGGRLDFSWITETTWQSVIDPVGPYFKLIHIFLYYT
ncbi:hypothetical protein HZH68_014131 [Vespula germanica]|uniref:Uncharacterized protein n=1 Tax=Vespula germanica TaxID=30212 RepID=A0A834J9X9_VESGE|nr:hypothetical protein HZH68_014131 [Vespula germanica]